MLVAANLFGGIGVAAGISAGGLLAANVAGVSWAGFAQAASTLGAAIAAVPLARMATTRGRRRSLSQGYAMAGAGAVIVVVGALLGHLLVLLPGMALFGIAQATNLQTRYAAAENVPLASRARAMSLVLWATTIGSVAGPNMLAPGADVADAVDLPALSGPFLFSVIAFAVAATVIGVAFRSTPPQPDPTTPVVTSSADDAETPGAIAALRWAAGRPRARFAVALIALAHAVMVMVMVMTPVHMEGHGDTLEFVGIVISLHVFGMYGLSPVFGWAIDRFGTLTVAAVGLGIEGLAVVLGYFAAAGSPGLTVTALILLGIGWSGCVLAGSALLASDDVAARVKVPLQGASDAAMNYAGACGAALAGPILAIGGFHAVNIVAGVVLAPALLLWLPAYRARGGSAVVVPR